MNTIELAKNIRKHVLKMTSKGKSSHVGSALSIADILAVLYTNMNINPKDPIDPKRDRFILSKGHAGAAVYAVLAELGFFSKEILDTHYQDGSILSGHVSHKGVPGVEFSTGSLGHGLSVASGFALAAKRKSLNFKSYVLLSDGELDEGSNWEAILFAPHHNLDNLTCIVDYNKLQSLTSVEETLNLEPLKDKITSFGWNVIDIDGHNHDELQESIKKNTSKPKFIIANTIKGKGFTFSENNNDWHHSILSKSFYEKALKELG